MIFYVYLASVLVSFMILCGVVFMSWWEGDNVTISDLCLPLLAFVPLLNVVSIFIVFYSLAREFFQQNKIVFKGRKQ